jgi:type IV pilus assembly protein PilQ
VNQHQHQLKLWMVAPALLLGALPVQATSITEAVAEAKGKEKLEISHKAAQYQDSPAEWSGKPGDSAIATATAENVKTAASAIATEAETVLLPSPPDSFANLADVDAIAPSESEADWLAQSQTLPNFNNQNQFNPSRIPAPSSNPDALVPNPQITIDGNPVTQNPNSDVFIPNAQVDINGMPSGVTPQVQPVAPAPPYLPRAVAPPVGDITTSTVNTATDFIDLGTAARVDSLILKDAPVREVLSFLARSAGLNVVYADSAVGGGEGGGAMPTISLDLENEPVQEAFNYVLQVSGLQANRRGRTIFVSTNLPISARNLISRTLRLNQVNVADARAFLIGLGAETQQVTTQQQITVVGEGVNASRITNTTTQVERIAPTIEATEGGSGLEAPLLLRGLTIQVDDRLNLITLVGEARPIEIATSYLTQLDARRRQVAINIKIVDVNLLNQDNFNASFSFGIADSFFSVDGGTIAGNYGQFRPATATETSTSLTGRPVINNPFAGSNTFLDLNSTTAIPGTLPGTVLVSPAGVRRLEASGAGEFFNRTAGLSGDPFTTGFTDFTLAEDNIITIDATGAASTTAGTLGTATAGLPSLFQFPRQFLASLQAQVVSGNAKILTDPTLVVQESQEATVNLTQQVFSGFRLEQTGSPPAPVIQTQTPILDEAGLILNIFVDSIDDNGFVTLRIQPEVSSPSGSVPTNQGPITLIQRRALDSGFIRMRDGQTLILAGIIQESDRTTVSKVPILGDIPILGALFRSTNRNTQRNEVIVLVTPQILDDTARFGDWGYNYTPGQDANQLLQRQGIQVPRNR